MRMLPSIRFTLELSFPSLIGFCSAECLPCRWASVFLILPAVFALFWGSLSVCKLYMPSTLTLSITRLHKSNVSIFYSCSSQSLSAPFISSFSWKIRASVLHRRKQPTKARTLPLNGRLAPWPIQSNQASARAVLTLSRLWIRWNWPPILRSNSAFNFFVLFLRFPSKNSIHEEIQIAMFWMDWSIIPF